MDVVLIAAGIVIILLGLRDMFHTLLRPVGSGRISPVILAAAWRLSRATGHRFGSVVGPAGMVVVIGVWVALQVVGWALIYLPGVPDAFTYSPGVQPADYPDFAEALYFSFVTLTTLGYGDVAATDPWMRAATPLEALTGFALLTAALTWFGQIYPPLTRRRALALRLHGLAESEGAEQIPALDPSSLSLMLDGLAAAVASVRVDFVQHSEGFYFFEEDAQLSLARQLPYALRLRDAAMTRSEPEVRLSAQQLTVALDDLAVALRSQFLRSGDGTEAVFAAFASDHGREPRG
ncbi:potassium channel family protein [Agrococcus sp. DT81.2]|uniref:potassium channel family protein n=1 Tax=Agrococcus sp. DT81.2 TaxID=3393414 RepID=UPI003CE4FA28